MARAAGFALTVLCIVTPACLAQTGAPTVTALAISPSTSVSTGTVVTLSATVTSGGAAVSPGLVLFCNAAAAHCEDSAILGQAQLVKGGVATLRLRLGNGSHSIKAIFDGTPHSATPRAGSNSSPQTVTVSGLDQSSSYPLPFGVAGNFTFNGAVHGFGLPAPTGTISFFDTTVGNSLLGSANLSPFGSSLGPAAQETPSFPGEASSVAVGDFNGDGIPDVATVNFEQFGADPDEEGTITIMLGNVDGTFTIRSSPDAGFLPVWVTTADFNSDGILDLAVTDNGNIVRILLGKGDGTFTALSPYTVGYQNYATTTADYNGDGIPDLAVSDEGTNTVNILLGKGDGTFTTKATTYAGVAAYAIVGGDFNGDGISDLALSILADANTDRGGLSILLGNGDGTFATRAPIDEGGCAPLATADFNGDGIPDLVTKYRCNESSLILLLGKGDGSFAPGPYLDAGLAPSAAVAADFNGDGIPDLAVADSGLELIFILIGEGQGEFYVSSTTKDGLYPYPYFLQIADFNGDGLPDLVAASAAASFDLILLESMESTPVVNNISLQGAGIHNILMTYSGDSQYLPSQGTMIVSNTTAPPQFAPPAGTYQWTQKVTLSDLTPGSVIYYTLDGSKPTTASAKYTSPIGVSWGATINAMAVSAGTANSPAAGATYSINRPLPPPVFSSPSGTYAHPFTFTLSPDPTSCTTGTCVLYYTINGAGYTRYTGPVTIKNPGTDEVKAITTEWHYTSSSPSTVTYSVR